VAYPVADVFLICAAIVLLVRGGRNVTNMNLGILALGFGAIAVTDSLYAYLSSNNDYSSGNYIDLGWMAAYALIIMAAASAAGRTLNVDSFRNDSERSIPVWQSLALNTALVPVAVLLYQNNDDKVIAGGFIALVVLAFASHLVTHFEIARLNGQLFEMAEALRAKVRTERIETLLQTAPTSNGDERRALAPETLTHPGRTTGRRTWSRSASNGSAASLTSGTPFHARRAYGGRL
jgi:hypothetical protein